MKTALILLRATVLFGLLRAGPVCTARAQSSSSVPAILTRDQASAVIPATVFYRGRTASVQARNSTGLRVPGDRFVLIAAVDTSGYSSSVQESYQDYLMTEVPLHVGGKLVTPGAYGVGFIAGDKFITLDLGGHALFTVPSVRDAALARPNPLQILADPAAPGLFRLYSGRSYVTLTVDPQ